MCLSTVYKGNTEAPENILAEYVVTVETDGETLRFTDITGEQLTLRARITQIDLIKGKIYITDDSHFASIPN